MKTGCEVSDISWRQTAPNHHSCSSKKYITPGGRARDEVLNLESRGSEVTAEAAILELLKEFGEGNTATMPIATFFARKQRFDESSTEYAIALDALLRHVQEKKKRQGENRDLLLTTQFMSHLHDKSVRQRLASMNPRSMTFRSLRKEPRVVSEEARQARGEATKIIS